ncbi:SPFH domain-containing protein [Aliidiomarina maris]|uniref:Regulator of protease activity HflC (Stomatin/prohibitin superfamily) n=1 Tax=Aliidiomarina maris TaxID=531312 RepID=A0A327WXM9_9GAMM|nr:SPFH domain-containing protein [Aliidiomarina maris]MCL5050826.1 SPFH domain-containing protein [Bacillota bacterium]RAJ96974.1 regulator of protease activity HflC (stomatin/prohibitin superfamily) [Aliidiomarina maris]RUO24585.1 SPFH domain-containing protein [Aliidiomarina maris]
MQQTFPIEYAVIALAVVAILALSVRLIPHRHVALVERFGKYTRTLEPGLNFLIPFVEKISHKQSLRVQQLNVSIETKTADNVFVIARVSVQYFVESAEAAYNAFYQLDDPEEQITSYVFDVVRAQIPRQSLDNVFDNKDEISNVVMEQLQEAMEEFGFRIRNTLVTDIDPNEDVKRSMNRINAAERERRAAEHEAEAERIKIVKKAEADKESKILAGQGVAGQRKAIAEGLRESIDMVVDEKNGIGAEHVVYLLTFTNYVDALESIGKDGTVIMVPQPTGQLDQMDEIRNAIISGSAVSNAAKKKPKPPVVG